MLLFFSGNFVVILGYVVVDVVQCVTFCVEKVKCVLTVNCTGLSLSDIVVVQVAVNNAEVVALCYHVRLNIIFILKCADACPFLKILKKSCNIFLIFSSYLFVVLRLCKLLFCTFVINIFAEIFFVIFVVVTVNLAVLVAFDNLFRLFFLGTACYSNNRCCNNCLLYTSPSPRDRG